MYMVSVTHCLPELVLSDVHVGRVLRGITHVEKSMDTNHSDGRSCLFICALMMQEYTGEASQWW